VLSALATGHKVGIAVVAGVFIAFALASSFLLPAMRPQFPGRRVGLFAVVTILLTAGMLATIIALAKEPKEPREAAAETTAPAPPPSRPAPTTPAPAPATGGDAAAGKAVFETAGCTSCHTLKAANAQGTVGPNLDEKKPPAALVVDRVTRGKGVMPPFAGQLTPKQIQDVAAFVSSSAGKG
jgi:mono/diheme cytochrome c family protein